MLKIGVFLFALVAVQADNSNNFQPTAENFNTNYNTQQQYDAPQVVEAKQFRESIDSYG